VTDEPGSIIGTVPAAALVVMVGFQAFVDGITSVTVPPERSVVTREAVVATNPHPDQPGAAELTELREKAEEALHDLDHAIGETLARKDELDEATREAPDPVNQAEVRPGPDPKDLDGPSTGETVVQAGPYTVEDPKLTALDVTHAKQLHDHDTMTQQREAQLTERYADNPALEGHLEKFHSAAEASLNSLVHKQAAERVELQKEVFAEQQHTLNQQQITVGVPPPVVTDPTRTR
jgi:hypothetical protein